MTTIKNTARDAAATSKRKYSKAASKTVASALNRAKHGRLKNGTQVYKSLKNGHGGKVKSRKQAIAIGLSEARHKGEKAPIRRRRKSS